MSQIKNPTRGVRVEWYDESRAVTSSFKCRCLRQDNHPAFSGINIFDSPGLWSRLKEQSIKALSELKRVLGESSILMPFHSIYSGDLFGSCGKDYSLSM